MSAKVINQTSRLFQVLAIPFPQNETQIRRR